MKLKPCPFCGETKNFWHSADGEVEVFVTCGKCFSRGPVSANETWANKKWNKRMVDRRLKDKA